MIEMWLAIGLSGGAALLGAAALVRGFRSQRLVAEQLAALRRMQSDIHALCAGAISMGDHIESLERKLRRAAERQDQLESREPGQQVYSHAIRLAQKGAELDELVENCGLAKGEAELLLRLHRVERQRAASA